MDKILEILEQSGLDSQLEINDIPKIDLYMDQVIQLFERKFEKTKRDDEEKILTKTMINNYAKGKLFHPIKNKKYTKEHIMIISLIYQLKGSLSIKDIKTILAPLNQKTAEEDFPIEEFYTAYLNLANHHFEHMKKTIWNVNDAVIKELPALNEDENDYSEKLLLLISLVQLSNMYRKVAERLVDDIYDEKNETNLENKR